MLATAAVAAPRRANDSKIAAATQFATTGREILRKGFEKPSALNCVSKETDGHVAPTWLKVRRSLSNQKGK